MNKNKIIMSSIGGVAVVIALVLGYLTYAAWEEKEENVDSLESLKSSVKRLCSAKISPSQASVDAIDENKKTLEIWFGRALDVAARGDRSYPTLTVAEFCNQLRDEVAVERSLPGGVGGKIVAEDFAFGFRDILDEGKLPKAEELPVLQRQWGDVKFFADTIAAAGAVQLVSVEKDGKKPVEAQPAPQPAPRNRNQRQQQAEIKPLADAQSYTVVFLARPVALVKVVNEFAKAERFTVVDSLAFERANDALGAILGGKDKEEARPSRGRGRGRGRARASEESESQEGEEEVRRKGLVVDPVSDTPFTVTMKITTYDFGTKASGEESAAASEGEEEQK